MKRFNILLVGLLATSIATPAVAAIDMRWADKAVNDLAEAILSNEARTAIDTFALEQAAKVSKFVLGNPKTSCAIIAVAALLTFNAACSMVGSFFSFKRTHRVDHYNHNS